MSALPRLLQVGDGPTNKMSGVCKDGEECVGSPKLRLLRRSLLMVTIGIGRDTHSRLSESNSNEINGQKSQDWVPEPGGVGSPRPEDPARSSQPDRRGGPCVDQ